MKFGYLKDISTVDFSLPPDHSSNQSILPRKPANQLNVFLGVPRWNVKEWKGKVYRKTPKNPLQAYSQLLNSVEMNTTHYRIPRKVQVEKWKATADESFVFCPKVPQSVSHRNPLNAKGENAQRFFTNMQLLGEQLGHSFMQLSPTFKSSRVEDLVKFLEEKPAEFPLALELRHESWFADQQAFDQLFQTMAQTNVAAVMSDTAGRRDALHMRLSTPEVMVRYVGNDLVKSDYERLDEWAERLTEWKSLGLQSLYFFLHQHDDGLLPETINYFIEAMEKRKVPMPQQVPLLSMF